jgi:hypothetical protein
MKKRKMLYMKTILKEQMIFGTNLLQGKEKKSKQNIHLKRKKLNSKKTNPNKNKIKRI